MNKSILLIIFAAFVSVSCTESESGSSSSSSSSSSSDSNSPVTINSSGNTYVNAVKDILDQGQLNYQFDSDCQTTRVGGKASGYMDASLSVANFDVSQRYYAIISDGYAISFIQTYADEQGAKNVAHIMDSIRFDQ